MNQFHFEGRLAKDVALSGTGRRAYAKFTLIRNEYAGRDDEENPVERQVAIQFTAFGSRAEALAKNSFKGDQLIVAARVGNNNYTDKDEVEHYGFEFIVNEFTFGAPGPAKRAELERRRSEQTPA